MQCPACQTENAATAASCTKCSTPLPLSDQTLGGTVSGGTPAPGTTPRGTANWSVVVTPPPGVPYSQGTELVGTKLAGRYEIMELLGQGGMGAVYKARDMELERFVALKLIRPDLANNPEILRRFKQELILAREVSHRNVIRIFDLGQAEGFKFITMEFVEGRDLRAPLRERGKLSPDEAVRIIAQVCRALEAAHIAGVVHRDLKPQNIMLDAKDRVYVMDFGIAHSLETPGMTQTGALMGTPEYMSPEQAKGMKVDARSDLFALGIIFYELLTGISPYKADTAMATLLKRTQERPQPPAELDPTIPRGISDVVMKCLEIDRDLRFSSAREILEDLGHEPPTAARTVAPTLLRAAAGTKPTAASRFPRGRIWIAGAGVATLLILFLAIPRTRQLIFPGKSGGASVAGNKSGLPSLSQGKFLAVLPFRVLGDATALGYVADGLGEALSAKLFQLKDVRLTSSAEAAKTDPKIPLPQVAKELGVNLIVHGTVQSSGDNLRITVNLENVSDSRLVWSQEFAGVTGDLLTIEDQIYARLVDALETKPSNAEMAAASAHPTENVEAYNQYLKGRNALSGNPDEKNIQTAMNYFNGALQKDPGFALAYTGLADANLMMYVEKKDKYWSEKAVEAAKQAARLNDRLPEVHFALGSAYAATGQTAQAIEEHKRGLELAPNSDEAYRRLGNAYKENGQKEEALQALQKAVEINPYYWNNLAALGNANFIFGEPEKALKNYLQVIQLEPDNPAGYSNLGAVYFDMGKFEESIPAFQKSLQLRPSADTYTNLGTAFFYLKRYTEALPMFEKAVEMSPEDEMNMGNLADGYRSAGDKVKAAAAYEKAISLAYKELRVNPRDASVVGNLAQYYAKKGDLSQAKEFIKKARAMDRSNVNLIYIAAVVDTINNQPADAVKELTAALEKGYSLKNLTADPEFGTLQSRSDFQSMMSRFAAKKR
jgi:tetratricopeptide (TPR) repeat protein/TolB-like protein/predicted Ser/Thr protein kinase